MIFLQISHGIILHTFRSRTNQKNKDSAAQKNKTPRHTHTHPSMHAHTQTEAHTHTQTDAHTHLHHTNRDVPASPGYA